MKKTLKCKVIERAGVYTKATSAIVMEANKFSSNMILKHNGVEADLKSIIVVSTLLIKFGDEFEIIAYGNDAVEAVNAIESKLKHLGIV